MIQFFLFMSAFLAAMLVFDYMRTRNKVHGSTIEQELEEARNEIMHLKERVQHLETIVTADEDDVWGMRNKSGSSYDKESPINS
ncbi:hypothetical protein EP331_07465 [bacterium]|nr:MAG: hypothetical protein EP331_07465 [bacterium]